MEKSSKKTEEGFPTDEGKYYRGSKSYVEHKPFFARGCYFDEQGKLLDAKTGSS